MTNLFLRKVLGVTTIFAMFLTFVPLSASASWLGAPSNVTLEDGIYTNDTTPTATWTRPANATWYQVLVDNGEWQNLSNVGSYTLLTQTNGWHTFYVRARGNNNTVSTSGSVTFEIDTIGPTVSTVSPSSAIEDVSTAFSISTSGEAATSFCDLYVSGSFTGSMTKSGSTFSKSYTFANDGSYTVYARCTDGDGNSTTGTSRTVTVSNQSTTYTGAVRGSLIKIPCGVYARTSETCKAVYYFGNDGKRHVFANESVFYTWYSDFDDVVNVSQDFMSSLTIGKNVTYRPGSVVVKFDSSSKVYAIQADHTLRHYTTLSLLKSDYGTYWTNVLAKVPDSLYSNYTIGSVIDNVRDYDRDDAYYSVDSIDDVL